MTSESIVHSHEADEKHVDAMNWDELEFGGILEGLKAIRTKDGLIQLFRPEENALRMKMGAERLCMPCPSTEQFLAALNKQSLPTSVPPSRKGVLYIRPLLIGSGPVLGLGSATEYTFLIFATPIGSYHKVTYLPMQFVLITNWF
ncbi:branched-chain-amino-acid aminotransferase 7 [Pyrus ussuriensis x Pyrus communis]|uniref:Branched-chain-amino-acid aminotransferase 7 n=1 Tax=Pyrus ussuriensis x Pyrus communis TaxID=2448454 RepID=A0A5N5FU02_9ROSA|nr:branched-chain-amino-acid aminotransferase 7 [Pyrus ussuriensis x Pyrus communis]